MGLLLGQGLKTYSHLWNSSAARTLILANFSIEYRLILHTTVISFSIIPQQHSYLNHNFNSSGQRISIVVVIFENVSTQHYYSAVYYYLLSEISKKHPYYLTHYYLVNESTQYIFFNLLLQNSGSILFRHPLGRLTINFPV